MCISVAREPAGGACRARRELGACGCSELCGIYGDASLNLEPFARLRFTWLYGQARRRLLSKVIVNKAADVAELADALDSKIHPRRLQSASDGFTQQRPNPHKCWRGSLSTLRNRLVEVSASKAVCDSESVAKSVAKPGGPAGEILA